LFLWLQAALGNSEASLNDNQNWTAETLSPIAFPIMTQLSFQFIDLLLPSDNLIVFQNSSEVEGRIASRNK
jgi:hypothetical protein